MEDYKHIAFLVGPGRSGTTMLYKLLAAHPQVGFLSNYLSHFPRIGVLTIGNRFLSSRFGLKRAAWFDEGGGAFFDGGRNWHKKFVPSPEECESVYQRGGIPSNPPAGWVPPREVIAKTRSIFERAGRFNGTPVLLSKRTANNRRIPQLSHIFPGSRYIALIRDGRAVAQSLVRVSWWDDHVLYWNGRTPRQLTQEGADPLDLAARNWVQEMEDMRSGLSRLPSEQVLEVSYTSLLASPRVELARMLTFLGVDPAYSTEYWRLIDTLDLKVRPESWRAKWSSAQRTRVEAIQGSMLKNLGFSVD